MIIPYNMLNKDTLEGLVEEFVSRDGTDNGYDQDIYTKRSSVMKLLTTKEAAIVFDSKSQSTNIMLTKHIPPNLG